MEQKKPLLMIVDDDTTNIKSLEFIFGKEYRLIPRKSGEMALKYFETLGYTWNDAYGAPGEGQSPDRIPDLILLDIMMPGIDGYEVCAQLKAHPELAGIPIIFVTGKMEAPDVTRGFEIGAVDYVTKPFNGAELKARVTTHLSLMAARESLVGKNLQLEKQMDEIEEKTEALRQKDAQLVMMDRIAGIGTLAAGIAHEINNPLGFLKSSVINLTKASVKMARTLEHWQQKNQDEFIHDAFAASLEDIGFDRLNKGVARQSDRIIRGIERISVIVDSLKSFSRVDMEEAAALDINNSIDEALAVLLTAESTVRLEKKYGTLPPFECTANEIHQCLLHLFKNAIDAVEEDGLITIETSYDEEKQRLLVRIEDNGPGMSEEVLKQAFNPFFTTKPVGQGTGVGLSIAEHTIKNHKGGIDLASKEGEGATVSFWLPVAPTVTN